MRKCSLCGSDNIWIWESRPGGNFYCYECYTTKCQEKLEVAYCVRCGMPFYRKVKKDLSDLRTMCSTCERKEFFERFGDKPGRKVTWKKHLQK
jgi:hypothetical protein